MTAVVPWQAYDSSFAQAMGYYWQTGEPGVPVA
jgi:hypothetical protein